jgi:hypothetical protein
MTPQAHFSFVEAWKFFAAENGPAVLDMTIKEIFEMGYLSAYHDRDGEWEDGYRHGYDEGRYDGIKE